MSRVKDIVQDRQLFSVEEQASVAEAARRMTDLHVGAIVVLNGGNLQGVFSERDIMKRVVLERLDPERTPVRSVMSTKVVTIDESHETESLIMRKHLLIALLLTAGTGILTGIFVKMGI